MTVTEAMHQLGMRRKMQLSRWARVTPQTVTNWTRKGKVPNWVEQMVGLELEARKWQEAKNIITDAFDTKS